ncbi:AraC family transcriptional regulator [Paenibacillus ginsengarvi]|uniref:AraC family transcriptional regulator n=1 Tax=Paenibacillus ginsengarvi TaxID=400777 RepID=A0A3B0BQ76_9BACL|nr:AraC family transcriptional regulator [Paenibacillus ginsengarvi]RKN74187.1 AraC family transcriptional regulator [Paenibacillus ginsengarvi]
MAVFPQYEDAKTDDRFVAGQQKGTLPFYISCHQIGMSYPMHYHDFAELSFVLDGSGTETINGCSHALKTGTMSLLLPHHIHELTSSQANPVKLYSCMFDMNILFGNPYEAYMNRWIHKIGSDLPSFHDFEGESLRTVSLLIEQLVQEYKESRIGRDAVLRGKLIEVVTYFLRGLMDGKEQTHSPEQTQPVKAWSILRYIHLHYNEPISLSSVSAHFHLHPSYISRMFKEHTGKTVNDYMHELRIARAATLLMASEMSISDICLEVGYDNYRTFARVFREHHQMSPSDYRMSHNRPVISPV